MGSSLSKTGLTLALCGLVALVASPAFSHGVHAPSKGAPKPVLVLEGEFVASELGGRPLNRGEDAPKATVIFLPDDGVRGSTGCNRFNGKLVRSGAQSMRFGPLGLTKMACIGPAKNLEVQMLAALRATNQISKFGSEVRLLSASSRVLARLQTISARPETGLSLYGKSWALVSLNGQALDRQSQRPQVTFESNRISGSTGCNQFSGVHQRSAGKSRFMNMMQTERACLAAIGDPMATEAAFMAALSQVDQISLTGNQLILKSTGSPDVLIFEAGN
ncbi:META domain-containing protein [Aquidulcibacter sp.]|uniref:META domain-containing protein n=1 Tax=Aquidulcibacter sp. TaxID=2052990 RepID=UPI0037C12C56